MSNAETEDDYEGFEKSDVQKLLLKSFMVVIFCLSLIHI